uniref:WRKY19-like zinc finger domain-containing protein n=1 Tax=Phytophthora ramorum TaxID=164328 RepID=H3H7Y9_PHYRM
MVVADASLVAYQTPFFPFRAPQPCQTYVVGPTLSPPSFRLPSIAMMHQDDVAGENSSTPANQNARHKAALSFILSSDSESDADEPRNRKRDSLSEPTVAKRRRSATSMMASPAASTSPKPTAAKKGSKFCTVEGCTSRAKHAKRCWKHGGWVRCKVPDCNNRAKSKGVCWSHGGGTVCSFESCDTIAVSNGFCWAHGGGKRCQVANCSKPAYERTQNYCQTHYEEFGAGAESKTS